MKESLESGKYLIYSKKETDQFVSTLFETLAIKIIFSDYLQCRSSF